MSEIVNAIKPEWLDLQLKWIAQEVEYWPVWKRKAASLPCDSSLSEAERYIRATPACPHCGRKHEIRHG